MTQLPTQPLLALAVVSRTIFGAATSASRFPLAFQGLVALAPIGAFILYGMIEPMLAG